MRILIPTIHRDIHAVAVSLALRAKGHEATLLYGADFPVSQHNSIHLTSDGVRWRCVGPEIDLDNTVFDTVWYRRPTMPILPESLRRSDKRVAERSCEYFFRSFWQLLAPDAFWVNSLASRARAILKPIQLLEAVRVGLKIPPTLFSNDPKEIRLFIESHEEDTIYKTHYPAVWRSTTGLLTTMTAGVGLGDLPTDDILCLSSGIFQKKVDKAYEVRLNMMGNFSIPAKILSQDNAETSLDWRVNQDVLKIERLTEIPSEVEESCRMLMRNLGIVFGCFDFIVTPEGDYIFLEINESGQFLWIEEMDPNVLMLDPFCDFLLNRTIDFKWEPGSDSIHFESIRDEAIYECERARKVHQADMLQHLEDD